MPTTVQEPAVKLTRKSALELLKRIPREELIAQLADEDPFLWIYKNVPTENGTKLDFSRRPYLVQILRDYSPHMVYKKSAQIGITMSSVAKTLYVVDNLGINGIYTFPTAREVGEFSKGRFRNIIRSSRYLSSRIGDIDNVGLVKVGDSIIYFRGTFSTKQAISVPSDLNVHDELNFSDPEVRKTFSSRLDASEFMFKGEPQYGWEWDFSTPTLPRTGISALYDDSDQNEWWTRCSRCRRRQRVKFFDNLRSKGKGRKKVFHFGCRKCDKELDRTVGEWKARKPENKIRGYHITQPMCAFINANKMVDIWEKDKKTPEGKRKFHNFNLGEDYEDGTETVTRDLILSRVVPSTFDLGAIYIGVDQGNLLHVEVCKMVDGRRRVIFIGELNSFDELRRMISHYRPRTVVIDALPNHHNALELAAYYYNVYVCYYSKTANNKLERKYWEKELEDKRVVVPRTEVLDRTAAEWNSGNVVIEDIIPVSGIEEFASQMTALKRSYVKDNTGQEIAQWNKVGDDHYRHADTYCWIASQIGRSGSSQKVGISDPYADLVVAENIFTEEDFPIR